MQITKTCLACKKDFTVPHWREAKAQTCSRGCKAELASQAHQAKRPKHRCKWCDKEFTSPPSQADRRVYCSTKCADKAKVGLYYGPLAPDGNTTMHGVGYVLERAAKHPFAAGDYVMQHRLVMEQWMREAAPDHHFLTDVDGVKYLRREIHVHHRNEVKDDNGRTNLLACTAATHLDIHAGRPVMKGTAWPETGDEIEAEQRTFIKKCPICRTKFKAKRSDILRGAGKFCSKSCATRSRYQK